MTHAEFVEWRVFARHEPLGSAKDDLHTAMLMLLLATINKAKRGKKPRLDDFLVDYWDTKRSPATMARKFRELTENVATKGTTPTAEAGTTMRGRRRQEL